MAARFTVFVVFLMSLGALLFLNHYKDYDPNKKVAIDFNASPETHEEQTPATPTLSAAERGKVIYEQTGQCITCHGPNAEGLKVQEAPKLAGQYDWYLVSQLKNFKSKERVNEKMDPYIKDLTEKDFEDVSAYLSSLK